VPGGGVALLRVKAAVQKLTAENPDVHLRVRHASASFVFADRTIDLSREVTTMRMAMFTTAAVAALSLSLAAVAQTSGGGSPGAAGGSPGGASSGATGAGSGSQQMSPQGGASGGASSGTASPGSTTGAQQSQGTAPSGQQQRGQAATPSGQQQGQGAATSGQQQPSQGTASTRQPGQQGQGTTGPATTTGSTSVNVNLSGEQRTRAVQTLRSVNIQPVRENITISVGQTLPSTVTQMYDCPETLVSLITGIRECKVVLVNDRYYIVEPGTRRVVTVIERQG
jgi:hypothetical protein